MRGAAVHPWVGLAARVYLGGVFVFASWHKILDPAGFALDVAAYGMLPTGFVTLTAVILPWLELFAGIMLVVGFRTRAAAVLVSGMMVVFMAALGSALARGLDMNCGCFATSGHADPISGWTMARDAAWLGMGLYVCVFDRRPLGADRLHSHREVH